MASKRAKRRKEQQTCARKKKYTRAGAMSEAVKMRTKFPGQILDGYPCGLCGNWHVGHRPRKVQWAISSKRRQEAI